MSLMTTTKIIKLKERYVEIVMVKKKGNSEENVG